VHRKRHRAREAVVFKRLVDGLDIVKEPGAATPASSSRPEAITHAPWDKLGCVRSSAEKNFHFVMAYHLN
jgi:hypothetical protein